MQSSEELPTNGKPHLSLSAARSLSANHVPSCWSLRFAFAPLMDCSMFRRLAFSTSHRLLRTLLRPPCSNRRFDSALIALRSAPFADCSAPVALRRAAHGLLRARHFRASRRFRIAPSSTLDAPRRSQISLRSTRCIPHPSQIAPLRVLDASVQVYGSRRTQTLHAPAARMDFSVLAAFAPRHHRLLCIRHLMLPGLMDISTIPFRIPR